jgi:hypothetical protein
MKGAWLDTPPRRRRRGFCSLSIEKSTNRHRKFFSQGDALMTDGNPPVRPPSYDKKIGLGSAGRRRAWLQFERRRRPIGRVRCSRRQTGLSSSTQSLKCGSRHGDPCRGANAERDPMPPTTSADDTLIAAHLASGILAATMRVASVENPAAQAPLAAKLYFDCHDALRAERKRRYEV